MKRDCVILLTNIVILLWLKILEDAHHFLLLSWLLGNSVLLLGLLQGAFLGTDFFLHNVTGNDKTFHWMESQSAKLESNFIIESHLEICFILFKLYIAN